MRDSGVTEQEFLGLFESVYDNDVRAADLNSQIKAISADSNEQFKGFADDTEIKIKILKNAYKYWKEKKENPDDDDTDYFTILGVIDNMLEEGDDNS